MSTCTCSIFNSIFHLALINTLRYIRLIKLKYEKVFELETPKLEAYLFMPPTPVFISCWCVILEINLCLKLSVGDGKRRGTLFVIHPSQFNSITNSPHPYMFCSPLSLYPPARHTYI